MRTLNVFKKEIISTCILEGIYITISVFQSDDVSSLLSYSYYFLILLNLPLQVNEKFAIDLINEIPPIKVKARSVWCDGGSRLLVL